MTTNTNYLLHRLFFVFSKGLLELILLILQIIKMLIDLCS